MSDYTPTTDEVRAMYVTGTPPHRVTVPAGNAEFDRWITQHDREVRAAAIRDAAQWLRNEMDEPWSMRFASHLEVGARREETGGSIYDPEVPS